MQKPTNTGQWMTGKGLYEQMRQKSIIWGQIGSGGCGKEGGRA